MIRRPKPGETEEDLLRMQEEYLQEKATNQNIRPAAQVTNLRRTEPTKRASSNSETSSKKPSKYAQSKGLTSSEKRSRIEVSTGSVMGDILEKNIESLETPSVRQQAEDDQVYYPTVMPSLLGDIIEKNVDVAIDFSIPMPAEGFPVVTKRDPNIKSGTKSIHTLHLQKLNKNNPMKMDVDEATSSYKPNEQNNLNLPTKSFILASKESNEIHNENIKILNKLSEKEILEEQQKLMSTLDPNIIKFIINKRNKDQTNKHNSDEIDKIENHNFKDKIVPMETSGSNDNTLFYENDSVWENDILSHPHVDKWLNFNALEKDKLEWMRGIEESKKVKSDEPYEARFDFKGYLLPYTMEYSEKTKTLYHHGEEPHRPGYSLTELFELSRSTIIQQRVMALNTLAGILEYYSAGTYKDIIEIPLSKIFFVVRIGMDENKVIILEPALKAMRNLLFNRIDEACLDALLGFEEGTQQPCLQNDKSEIEELDSAENELKDFHLAEIDIVSAAMRTDIIQRLYYILETVKPTFNSVQYSLQILTRLARDSIETAGKIVETEYLMESIIQNFVPTTSINFAFQPEIVYNGKPVLAAVKFLRILSLQSKEVGIMLISRYQVLKPISEYISSGVDGTYGIRVQIEAFCVISNFLNYGLGIENALSLIPVVVSTLHKHVQGTEIYISSSILSATHAAVVLQFINKLLNLNLTNLDHIKHQIYPLMKEGVQKWIAQLSRSDNYTCGHLRVLCAITDCCKTILLTEDLPVKVLNDSLRSLSTSKGYKALINNIIASSNLLSDIEAKDIHLTNNLVTLGGSVIDNAQKVLPMLNVVSPIPFLASLFKLLVTVNNQEITNMFIESIVPYLKRLSEKSPSLCDNWFTRIETNLLISIVELSTQIDLSESIKDLVYAVANKLCYILRIDKKNELEFLFNNIVFNKHWFTAERLMSLVHVASSDGFSKALTSLEEIKYCYSKVVNLDYQDTGPNVMLVKWKDPILPRDWIYLPILTLYGQSQDTDNAPEIVGEHAKRVSAQKVAEKELIISCSLEWILFNELCFPELLNDIDATDRLCRLMCVFLCDNSLFLDPKINVLLNKCTQTLFKQKKMFNFDKQFVGLNNFQDFYTQLLEQFQSVSYGDPVFASCVLVPLAQKHNVKWRKLLWSEYAGCLRALDCPKELLCYDLKEYLEPEESEESLIKSYFLALSSNLLRSGTIAHTIALHHAKAFKSRSTT